MGVGTTQTILDAERCAATIRSLADQIGRWQREEVPLALVGIRTLGVPLADRIADQIADQGGPRPHVGAVDITLYRDDLHQTIRWPVLHGTEITFPVEGTEVVLIDDVMSTGRTARAAMNAVCDLGRPSRIRLVVLIDRGGRELPIEPDLTGARADAPDGSPRRVEVRLQPIHDHDKVLLINPQAVPDA